MITHKIERPSLIQCAVQRVVGALGYDRPAYQGRQRMDKLAYTKWVEEVKQEWKVGDLATLKPVVAMPNILPMYYRVTFIDELCHNVPYDYSTWEPLALTCVTSHGMHMCKSPNVMRHLTEEEEALVRLSNQKPAGTS